MAEQVQELIDKIKSEGIQAADQKAQEIQSHAQKEAQRIVENAKQEAQCYLRDAKEEIKKMQESTQMALRQASRDTLLALKKEIRLAVSRQGARLSRLARPAARGLAGYRTASFDT